MAKKETVKKEVPATATPEVKKDVKKVEILDNKIYKFQAKGGAGTRLIKDKIYVLSGSSARVLVKKGLGKIV